MLTYLPDAPLRGRPIEFYLFSSRLCVHINHNQKLQYANSDKVILELKPNHDNHELIGWRLKLLHFIQDMKNFHQNISPSVNSFANAPPLHENESHKLLSIFYRTASKSLERAVSQVPPSRPPE